MLATPYHIAPLSYPIAAGAVVAVPSFKMILLPSLAPPSVPKSGAPVLPCRYTFPTTLSLLPASGVVVPIPMTLSVVITIPSVAIPFASKVENRSLSSAALNLTPPPTLELCLVSIKPAILSAAPASTLI